jgi:hypothetical protein
MDPTVTVDSTSSPAPVWARHDTVLTDTHDRHAHIVVPKDDVAVKSWLPKLRPSTLNQYPPEVGALTDENDVTGAEFPVIHSKKAAVVRGEPACKETLNATSNMT